MGCKERGILFIWEGVEGLCPSPEKKNIDGMPLTYDNHLNSRRLQKFYTTDGVSLPLTTSGYSPVSNHMYVQYTVCL